MTQTDELLTPERLKEIEARANAATPPPWLDANPDDSACMNIYCVTTGNWEPDDETQLEDKRVIAVTLLQTPAKVGADNGKWAENAEFIAHARTDVPALIGEVRRLQANCSMARDFIASEYAAQNDDGDLIPDPAARKVHDALCEGAENE